ncbi:MAG: phosphoribosylanthranilate isomerase [Erythrobacter sp.]|nr:phosphoribosylanthranilate isomerase [Erythrobacter sp.]
MSVQIKICGLSTPETVEAAIAAGATHIGLNLYEPSPRYVALERAAQLRELARRRIAVVILLVDADPEATAHAIATVKPDIVQFHGSETPEWVGLVREKTGLQVWKALGVSDADTLERSAAYAGKVDRLLFDAPATTMPGGTGRTFAWDLLKGHRIATDWGLAGGLTPGNVAEAIRVTGAPLVDTSSGVESAPGVKDVDLIRAFCEAARNH